MCEAALVAQTSQSRPSPRGSGSTSSIRIETTPAAIATGDARHISTVSRPLWWVARSRDRVLEDGQLAEQPDGRRAARVAAHRGVILPRALQGAPRREQWRARSNCSSRAPLTRHHHPQAAAAGATGRGGRCGAPTARPSVRVWASRDKRARGGGRGALGGPEPRGRPKRCHFMTPLSAAEATRRRRRA